MIGNRHSQQNAKKKISVLLVTAIAEIKQWNLLIYVFYSIKQGRIVHRSSIENKIIYKIDKGEKGLIDK